DNLIGAGGAVLSPARGVALRPAFGRIGRSSGLTHHTDSQGNAMICLRAQAPVEEAPMLRATWTKPPIRTVLAAVALSRRAAAIARLFGAELHLVHAGPDTREARRKLRINLASTNLPVSTPTIIQSGRPDRVVCEAAESIGADLIVAGVMRRDSTLAEHANS